MTLSNLRGLHDPVRTERKARRDMLNASYRAEGWPRITDAALGIDPCDVEAQARKVAAWAAEREAVLEAALRKLVACLGQPVGGFAGSLPDDAVEIKVRVRIGDLMEAHRALSTNGGSNV